MTWEDFNRVALVFAAVVLIGRKVAELIQEYRQYRRR